MVFHKHDEWNEIAYEDMRIVRCTVRQSSCWKCILKHVTYGGCKILTEKRDWHFWYYLSIRIFELLKWRTIRITITKCWRGKQFFSKTQYQPGYFKRCPNILCKGTTLYSMWGFSLLFFFLDFPCECRDVICKHTMTVFSAVFSTSLYITILTTVLISNVVHSLYSEFKYLQTKNQLKTQ